MCLSAPPPNPPNPKLPCADSISASFPLSHCWSFVFTNIYSRWTQIVQSKYKSRVLFSRLFQGGVNSTVVLFFWGCSFWCCQFGLHYIYKLVLMFCSQDIYCIALSLFFVCPPSDTATLCHYLSIPSEDPKIGALQPSIHPLVTALHFNHNNSTLYEIHSF